MPQKISERIWAKLTEKFPKIHGELKAKLPSRTHSLAEGVDLLLREHEALMHVKGAKPFFFMVGAGLSHPPVPLASEIIMQCAGSRERGSGMAEYERAITEKHPTPLHRQSFFQKLIEGNYVSTGNYRLAHLLLAHRDNQRFANLVVTTNFDDFLSRALQIFGEMPRVYHHPEVAQEALFLGGRKIDILHLHGSYQFYDIANLNAQVADRAIQMRAVMDRVLEELTPLVIGYSGWEQDAFMQGLSRRFPEGSEPAVNDPSVYWFCYRQSTLTELPESLLRNLHVRFVVPEAVDDDPPEALEGFYGGAPTYMEKNSILHTLPSTQVLDALIGRFELEEPLLITNPAASLANLLDGMLPPDAIGNRYRKQYFLRRIVRQLRHYGAAELDMFEKVIQEVLRHIRISKYEEAHRLGLNLWNGAENKESLKAILKRKTIQASALQCACDLMDAFWSITFGITSPQPQQYIELEAYNACIEIARTLLELECKNPPRSTKDIAEQLVTALLHRAVWLSNANNVQPANGNKPLEAKREFAALARKYGTSGQSLPAIPFAGHTAWALLNRGILSMPKDPRAALRYFRKIEGEYCPDPNAEGPDTLLEPWIKAVCNSAVVYLTNKNFRMALAKAGQVVAVPAGQKEASEVAAVREKAKKIEEHCGKIMSENLYPAKRPRRSSRPK
jgi:hypothetical protein